MFCPIRGHWLICLSDKSMTIYNKAKRKYWVTGQTCHYCPKVKIHLSRWIHCRSCGSPSEAHNGKRGPPNLEFNKEMNEKTEKLSHHHQEVSCTYLLTYMWVLGLGFVAHGLPIAWLRLDKWHIAKTTIALLPSFGFGLIHGPFQCEKDTSFWKKSYFDISL